jgi:hypothetical protein
MRSFQEVNSVCLFALLSLYHLPQNYLSRCREEAKSKRIAVACSTSHLITVPYFHLAEQVHIRAPSQYPKGFTTCFFSHLILHFFLYALTFTRSPTAHRKRSHHHKISPQHRNNAHLPPTSFLAFVTHCHQLPLYINPLSVLFPIGLQSAGSVRQCTRAQPTLKERVFETLKKQKRDLVRTQKYKGKIITRCGVAWARVRCRSVRSSVFLLFCCSCKVR